MKSKFFYVPRMSIKVCVMTTGKALWGALVYAKNMTFFPNGCGGADLHGCSYRTPARGQWTQVDNVLTSMASI